MLQPLTKEIIENDDLWDKWFLGELRQALKPVIDEYERELEHEILNGIGKDKPVGILNTKPT